MRCATEGYTGLHHPGMQEEAKTAKEAAEAATAAEQRAVQKVSELNVRLQEARTRVVTGAAATSAGVEVTADTGISAQLAKIGKLNMELQVILVAQVMRLSLVGAFDT